MHEKDYGDPITDEQREVAIAACEGLHDVYLKMVADVEAIASHVANTDYSEFLIQQETVFDELIAQIRRANDV